MKLALPFSAWNHVRNVLFVPTRLGECTTRLAFDPNNRFSIRVNATTLFLEFDYNRENTSVGTDGRIVGALKSPHHLPRVAPTVGPVGSPRHYTCTRCAPFFVSKREKRAWGRSSIATMWNVPVCASDTLRMGGRITSNGRFIIFLPSRLRVLYILHVSVWGGHDNRVALEMARTRDVARTERISAHRVSYGARRRRSERKKKKKKKRRKNGKRHVFSTHSQPPTVETTFKGVIFLNPTPYTLCTHPFYIFIHCNAHVFQRKCFRRVFKRAYARGISYCTLRYLNIASRYIVRECLVRDVFTRSEFTRGAHSYMRTRAFRDLILRGFRTFIVHTSI